MPSLPTRCNQEKSPISSDGLNIFLQSLVKARCGACPLLEVSSRQVMVPAARLFEVVDYVFSGCMSFERERIKTDIFDQFGGKAAGRVVEDKDAVQVDLEVVLEYVLMQYDELTKRWDSRLESMFAANDSDGNGSLDLKEFQVMCMCLCVCGLCVSLCVRMHVFSLEQTCFRCRSHHQPPPSDTRLSLVLKLIYSRTEYDAQAQRELVELSGSIHGQFAHVRKHVHFSSCGRLGLLQNCQKVSAKCFHARQWL